MTGSDVAKLQQQLKQVQVEQILGQGLSETLSDPLTIQWVGFDSTQHILLTFSASLFGSIQEFETFFGEVQE